MTNATNGSISITNLNLRANTVAEILAARRAALEQAALAAVKAASPAINKAAVVAGERAQRLPEVTIKVYLEDHLPKLVAATVDIVTPPFAWKELTNLAQVVSEAVVEGLPQAPQLELEATISAITGVLYDTYAAPKLPIWAKPFSGLVRGVVLKGVTAAIEFAQSKAKKPAAK